MINKEDIQKELEKRADSAKKLLLDNEKLEEVLQRMESKLKKIPVAGEKLANVPAMLSLTRSYVKKEYTNVSMGSIILVVSTLLYVVSPFDLIPDAIPIAGYLDDAVVIGFCLDYIDVEIEDYNQWRKENNKLINA